MADVLEKLPEPRVQIEGKIINPDGTEIPFVIDTKEQEEDE